MNSQSHRSAAKGGLRALLAVVSVMWGVGSASAADPIWILNGTPNDITNGDAGFTRSFVDAQKTLKAAAFRMNPTTGMLSTSALGWFNRNSQDGSDGIGGGDRTGGLGVVGPGESGVGYLAALVDNVADGTNTQDTQIDVVIFALPEDGMKYISFYVDSPGTAYNTDLLYKVGGTMTAQEFDTAPFARFEGKTLTDATSGWKSVSSRNQSSRDVSINSSQGYPGRYLIVVAESPNIDKVDRFAISGVNAKAPVGCQDQAAPTFTAPANQTLTSTASDECGRAAPDVITGLVGNDDCGGPVTFTQSPAKNTLLSGKGPHAITITARDGTGKQTSKVVYVTLEDLPTITSCPGLQTVNANDQCSLAMPAVHGFVAYVDYCSSSIATSQSPPPGAPLDYGTNTVVVAVDDGAGHIAVCTTFVVLTDETDPTIECPADIAKNTDPNQCSAFVDPGTPTANDNCAASDAIAVHGDREDNGPIVGAYPPGTTVLDWTATDAEGNSDACEQHVVVMDGQAPDLDCPAKLEVTTDPGVCNASTALGLDLGMADATDNCAIAGPPTNDAKGVFELGDTTVTWTVSDTAVPASTSTCEQIVNVVDDEAPTLLCPAPAILVSSSSVCLVGFGDLGIPEGDDNCDDVLKFWNDAVFPMGLGLSTVTWSVADTAGNTNATNDCEQSVTVLSGAGLGFLPPLRGQPVMNKVNSSAQTLPHKVLVTDCAGLPISGGVIVKLRVEGFWDPAVGEPIVVEDVLEDYNGRGEIIDGEAIMAHDGAGQYHFNVLTTAFGWPDTSSDSGRWYTSTASVYDAATGAFLGATSVQLETQARGKK